MSVTLFCLVKHGVESSDRQGQNHMWSQKGTCYELRDLHESEGLYVKRLLDKYHV